MGATVGACILIFGSYQESAFAVNLQITPISCALAHLVKLSQSTQTQLLPDPCSLKDMPREYLYCDSTTQRQPAHRTSQELV